MSYIHFTDEQKLRANSVDLAEFLRRQGEKLLPSGRESGLPPTTVSLSAGTNGLIMPQSRAVTQSHSYSNSTI